MCLKIITLFNRSNSRLETLVGRDDNYDYRE